MIIKIGVIVMANELEKGAIQKAKDLLQITKEL
jgi:hypothetical protein